MKPQFRWLAGLLPATIMFSAVEVCANPITFYFEGHVNFIHDYLQLDDSVYIGVPFSGNYTFDPGDVEDAFPNNPEVGQYIFGSEGRMQARIGNYDFVSRDLAMLIWNNSLSSDLYEPISTTPFMAAGYRWSAIALVLYDEAGVALNSDALPIEVPHLSDYPTFTGFNLHLPGNDLGIQGRLTSLTPEPGGFAFFGLSGLLIMCRKSR